MMLKYKIYSKQQYQEGKGRYQATECFRIKVSSGKQVGQPGE